MYTLPMPVLPPENEGEELITKNQISRLMIESYHKSASTTEEIMALKEVAKLNGMYEKQGTTINILHVEKSMSELEEMPDAQLLEMMGEQSPLLNQHPDARATHSSEALEAEFEELPNEEEASREI